VFRGPAPWLAPWLSGLVVEQLFVQRTRREKALVIELTSVLNGRDVEEKDFSDRRNALRGLALNRLVDDFRHRYDHTAGLEYPPEVRWPRDWLAVLRDRLEKLGPQNVFPFDLSIVRPLFEAHPKRGGQKRS
jgi:hypothetical protein